MTQQRNILGISLGTRTIGMAVMMNNVLVDWYVKVFKGMWSEHKELIILDTIDQMLERYMIDSFAIKIPNGLERHPRIKKLHTEINILAQQKGIATETYTIDSLKNMCGEEVCNKSQLRTRVLGQYPELKAEFGKEQKNRNTYYTKVFEATLAASMMAQQVS